MKPDKGSKYYIAASWTSRGAKVEECIWRDDYVDNLRLLEGKVFPTYKDAKESLCEEVNSQ